MPRAGRGSPAIDAHAPVGAGDHGAVVPRIGVRDAGPGSPRRPRGSCRRRSSREVEVEHHVAVHEEEGLVADPARAPCAARRPCRGSRARASTTRAGRSARPSPTAARTVRGRWWRLIIDLVARRARPAARASSAAAGGSRTGSTGLARVERERPHARAEARGQDHRLHANTMSPAPPDARNSAGVGLARCSPAGPRPSARAAAWMRLDRPLDLQEGPDRRLVDHDLDVAPVVGLAVLLVAEDRAVAEGAAGSLRRRRASATLDLDLRRGSSRRPTRPGAGP